MKSNLVIGLALGYDFEAIRPFLYSLDKTSFKGDVVIITDAGMDVPASFKPAFRLNIISEPGFRRPFIKKAFVKLLSYPLTKWTASLAVRAARKISEKTFLKNFIATYHCQTGRYAFYKRFLDASDYDNVFLTDIRDVIFQRDPFEGFGEELSVFHESPSITLKDEPFNATWLREAFGENEFRKIANCKIYCSGTILGSRKGITRFLETFLETCLDWSIRPNSKGIDQGIFNFLIHNNKLENISKHENGDIILTVSPDMLNKYHYVDGRLSIDHQMPAVVHQYDRFPELVEYISANLHSPRQVAGREA